MCASCEGNAMADGVTWAGAVQSFMPALVGGVIGSGSTILAGYLGWKRERVDRHESARREAMVQAEEARNANRRERATALLDGLAEATTALFLADKASENIQASDSQATQQALRESVANANIAIYRLLSLTRSEAVRAAIDQAIHEVTAFPHLIEAEATRSVVRALSDAVLSEHDALQPIASHPVG
jgi:hypothetical protein